MKRLLLDYFRRWWWVLALGSALQFRFGWSIARRPDDAFEFEIFLVALWMGAMLLGMDLKRGAARAVMALPLTAREIGRGWWLATIVFPALLLAGALFAGAGIFCHFHPVKTFPSSRLAMGSLFVLPWLATSFTSIYGMNEEVLYGNWRQRRSAFFFNILSVALLFGGMLTLQDSTKVPIKFAIYQAAGVVLMAAGWLRAEKFVLGRAGFRLPTARARIPSGEHRVQAGFGGLPFLMGAGSIRIFLWTAGMVALMALLMVWQGPKSSPSMPILMFANMGSFMSCGFIVVFQLLPALRELRVLRSLPVSPTRLAAVLIAIPILPLVALGVLVSLVLWLVLGSSAAITCLTSYTFILAPGAMCVFFVVWRGVGVATYVLLVVTLFGFQQVQLRLQMFLHLLELPLSMSFPIAATSVLLAFLLTRQVLIRGGRGCFVLPNPSVNFWGMGN